MVSGDIMYSNVDSRPLCVMVRRGDGQYWDFVAKAFSFPPAAFTPAQYCLALAPDPTFPGLQTGVIPAAATTDPLAVMVEALVLSGGKPIPTQSYWIGPLPSTVVINARGQTIRIP